MRKIYQLIFTGLALMVSMPLVYGQNMFFTDAGENKTVQSVGARVIVPQKFRTASLDLAAMKNFLWTLPTERNVTNRNQAPVLSLPKPDGSIARFRVWESSIQEPGLQAKFPDIRTYLGQGIDDPYSTIRFDIGPNGYHAQVLSANGSYYIDPYSRGDVNNYISYFRSDLIKARSLTCEVPSDPAQFRPENTEAACLGTQLRTYRLAIACTGEYAQAPGVAAGSNPAILHNAIVTTVNRVVGVYEQEVSVRMVLVANNNLVEFLNAGTDPFTGNNNANVLINESQTVIDANIGSANYDIGHTFSTGGGGLAQLSSVCGTSKARGITGSPTPTGDGYDIDYVAHEMGHQFGGNHSMAGCGTSPNSTKYEVGSGTTIQAYAGICPGEDIQPHSDPFFHAISFDEISNFVNGAGGTCAVLTSTGNTLPVIDPLPNNGLTIPVSTPFTLSGTASDINGDALTYCWEQWDLGGGSFYTWNAGATAAAGNTVPLFKSRVPKTNGSRTFPDIAVILANYPANPAATMNGLKGETLSPVSRPMNFRLTVRDNRAGGGGVASSGGGGCQTSTAFTVNVAGSAPFVVTSPNGGESYIGGASQNITWNVVGTNAAPFNVSNVKISLSTDGGLTYPTVLAASTANDGNESLAMPLISTTTARIKVEALGNIFFDISNTNFTITPPPNGFSFNSPAAVVSACPASNIMTSGNLTATWFGTFTGDVSLSGTVSPAGPTVSFGSTTLTQAAPSTTVSLTGMSTLSPGNYTVTVTGTGSGAPTQTRDIAFTINPGSGPSIATQPANQSACVGSTATFSVVATGTYQWQVNTGSGFTNISGATSASYTTAAVTTGMNGYQYQCIVSGQCGSTTTSSATLTVNTVPAVTTSPVSQSVCAGSAVTFSVAATGSGLTYQWQLNSGSGFADIAGANASSYNLATTTVGQNGYQYRCVVSGTCTPPATSNAATLNVSSTVTVATNPSNSTVCELTNTSFTVAASGTGLTYQWQVSTDGGTNYTNLSATAVYGGINASTLTLTAVPYTYNTYRYRCVVSSGVCTPGVSTAATLTVNTLPSISAHPANATICEGAANTFSVTATTGIGALTYQWQLSTNGGSTWGNITGATAATYAQASIPAGQNGYRFRVIVTAGCGSVTSNVAVLTVNTYPVVTFGDIPATICVSDGTVSLPAAPAGGTWSGSGVSGSIFTPSAAGVGAKSLSYSVTNAGCTSNLSKVITVLECAERHRLLTDYLAVFVYPVPNNGNFSIKMNTDLYKRLGVRVFGADGRMYHSQVVEGIGYGSVIPVDLSRLASGTYSLHMYNDEKDFIFKGVNVVIFK
ncbi:MAG TPA: zinc-dependent metalloprotease family protein [Chitinophagaceae bacterium]|jgi:hypothetical protein|nr:zinc-dependent metalloprotease family protein [Chitinophagaceae bacterium]HMU57863.1 zinc-dependent metalloprotease family protein [Chitinophagaceae bacterium]